MNTKATTWMADDRLLRESKGSRDGRDAVVAGMASVNKSRLYALEFEQHFQSMTQFPACPGALQLSVRTCLNAEPLLWVTVASWKNVARSGLGQGWPDSAAADMLQPVFSTSHCQSRGTEAASQFSWPPASNSKNLSVRRSSHHC